MYHSTLIWFWTVDLSVNVAHYVSTKRTVANERSCCIKINNPPSNKNVITWARSPSHVFNTTLTHTLARNFIKLHTDAIYCDRHAPWSNGSKNQHTLSTAWLHPPTWNLRRSYLKSCRLPTPTLMIKKSRSDMVKVFRSSILELASHKCYRSVVSMPSLACLTSKQWVSKVYGNHSCVRVHVTPDPFPA